ncbi:MAG: Hsp20/alpha crystallin family protein [Spirochaetales bacterium]|nr:Hsp20/alpha crystallin family protein [Spirochaetales bacterium]
MADKKELETKKRTLPAACDIYEENGKVVCRMEMPGVLKEDLDIRVDGNRLVINGKKKAENTKGDYRIREIRDGDYYHEFTLDDTIDRSRIDAAIKNGIVTLTLNIKEAEKPRKINIVAK